MDMDLLQGVRDAAEAANDAENPVNEESSPFGKMPSMNQILEMIETMNISDKEKEEIKKSIMSPNFEKLREFMPQHSNPAPFDPSRQYLYVLIGVAVLLLIFGKILIYLKKITNNYDKNV